MRTTLDIADDVLQAAKERARREKRTAGEVISELARSALTTPAKVGGARSPSARFRSSHSRTAVVAPVIGVSDRKNGNDDCNNRAQSPGRAHSPAPSGLRDARRRGDGFARL